MRKFEWPEVEISVLEYESIMAISMGGIDCDDDSGNGCGENE